VNRALWQRFESEVPRRLAELLDIPAAKVRVEGEPVVGDKVPDLIAYVGDLIFIAECKSKGEAALASVAARQVREFVEHFRRKAIPLVAVPFMGEVGRRICDEARVCWLDLSGNAHLFGPKGLRIQIEGKPNLFKRPGRPRTVFAPKSARIARWLLMKPEYAFSQRELAKLAGLDEGFTSRIVRQLEQLQLVKRESKGSLKLTEFDGMLDAWREAYDFSKHHIIRGHIAARSSDEILRRLARRFGEKRLEHALTGLAAAWALNQFAGFRLVVCYLGQIPSAETKQAIGFHEEERGENVWLVVPNDEGVFHGAARHNGVRCVHPVQVYLDLKSHPERAGEAAEQLRAKLLNRANRA
jgi:Holliday junction resolvase